MDKIDPHDVILYLIPHEGVGFKGASLTTGMLQNRSRLIAPRYDPLNCHDSLQENRAGSEPLVEHRISKNTACLVFLFSHGARTSKGVVAGRGIDADFHIQDMPGVSRYHFAITFDDNDLPIIRDLNSTHGIKITYDGEKGQRKSNFDWPLAGPSVAIGQLPILNITDQLQFKVLLPGHDYKSPKYTENVKKFRTGTGDPENLLRSLVIQGPQCTPSPSRLQISLSGFLSRPNLYTKVIGNGGFGVVIFVRDMVTREEYVVKQPLHKLVETGTFDENQWIREADIMRSISHEHIVSFQDANFSPYPQLRFEYIRGGSLDRHTDLCTFESTQILCQLSSALKYLHNLTPPIAHRDIKPENILVASRTKVDGIYVKFADFGISKAADILNTCCGTPRWAAPEIGLRMVNRVGAAMNKYSVAVDIWSLGAVVADLECGHPDYDGKWRTDTVTWTEEEQNHVQDCYNKQHSEILHLIIDSMLIQNPFQRSTADCVNIEAVKLLGSMSSNSVDQVSDGQGSSILEAQPTIVSDVISRTSVEINITDIDRDENEELEWPKGQDHAGPGLVYGDCSSVTGSRTVEAALTVREIQQEERDDVSLVAGNLHGNEVDRNESRGGVSVLSEGHSIRKRSWPKARLPLTPPHSFTDQSSSDKQHSISPGLPDPKRRRRNGPIEQRLPKAAGGSRAAARCPKPKN